MSGQDQVLDWTSSEAVLTMRHHAVPRGIGHVTSIVCDRGLNAEMWDVEGRRYIDFSAGIAVLNTGHNHPYVKAAVLAQLDKFSHSCFHVTQYPQYIALAQRLNDLVPGNSPKKTMLGSSGAEAVENAIKIARAYTGRSGVIAFSGGFHGRTMMAMALTGKTVPYKAGFGPFPGEVFHARFPNPYLGITVEESLESLESILTSDIDASRVAAIVVEPVQGEGGFIIAPAELMQALRRLCDDHGILLIIDEIQTGFARTGRMFAHEFANVEADIVTMAKGIAGGFPLSAVTGKAEIMDAPSVGGLGGTYAGSPIGCAAALAVLDVIAAENLCERATEIGRRITDRLSALQSKFPGCGIGDIRNLGAMIAIELVEDADPMRPDPARTKALIAKAQEKGLILLSCGTRGNVIRLLTALTIEWHILDEGLKLLAECMTETGILD